MLNQIRQYAHFSLDQLHATRKAVCVQFNNTICKLYQTGIV